MNSTNKGVVALKYDKQECPLCSKQVVTLYKKKREDIAVCYWCNKKREKENSMKEKKI